MIRKYLHIVLISAITLLGVALSGQVEWTSNMPSGVNIWQALVLAIGLIASLTAGRQAVKRMQANIVYR